MSNLKITDAPADREWQHASCLSIAEGVPGWDREVLREAIIRAHNARVAMASAVLAAVEDTAHEAGAKEPTP